MFSLKRVIAHFRETIFTKREKRSGSNDDNANDTADDSTTLTQQIITVGPVSNGDAVQFYKLAQQLELTARGLYCAKYV